MWICPHDKMRNEDRLERCPFCGAARPDQGPTVEEIVPAHERCESLQASQPQPVVQGTSERLLLTQIGTGVRIEVMRSGGIIGREGDFGREALDDTVSRRQLIVSYRDGIWSVRQIGRAVAVIFGTGGVVEASPALTVPIHVGDVLQLGEMFFDVTVEMDETPPEQAPKLSHEPQDASVSPNMVEGWFVDCPVCGMSFRVKGPASVVRECGCCKDLVDRRRIGRVVATAGVRPKGQVLDAR